MSEIRVRGWHAGNQTMFYPEEMAQDQMCLLPTGYFINVAHMPQLSRIDYEHRLLPLLSSGLNDVDGKEIYQGDIVENVATIGVVLFEDGMFCLSSSAKTNFGRRQPMCVLDGFKRIGNIYQNPELIPAHYQKGGQS